jgi:hypothetical protein
MQTAIFGFAASGKTEVFRALAGPQIAHTDRAMVKVPDSRLQALADVVRPRKVVPAEIEYLDVPGGGGREEGLGQRVLGAVRPCDCLLAVLDGFSGLHDPARQRRVIESDLIVSDLAVAEKRMERMALDRKKGKHMVDEAEEKMVREAAAVLEHEEPLRRRPEIAQSRELRGFSFLSAKPLLFLWNVDENDLPETRVPEETDTVAHMALCARLERELAELEDPEERRELLESLGMGESALNRIVAETYRLLGLITFFTHGEKEVRAWTAPRGTTALEAAGTVHSDMQRGFIRAEVLSWMEFERLKSFKAAREKGSLRLEGKEYPVSDGDIVTFRFNV